MSARGRVLLLALVMAMILGYATAQVVDDDHDDDHDDHDEHLELQSGTLVWVYALLASLIISLLPVILLLILARYQETAERYKISLLSFSVGTLVATAIFTLLAESVEAFDGFTDTVGFMMLAGLLFTYLIESVLHAHSIHQHCKHDPHDNAVDRNHSLELENYEDIPEKNSDERQEVPAIGTNEVVELDSSTANLHAHSKGKSMVMSVLVGDTLHNFIDGVLIGATFLVSNSSGITTSLAVAFHEIPQEISDYQILRHANMSPSKAIGLNFLSSLSALAGTIVGLAIGESADNTVRYLLPFATGMFFYLSLSDILPEIDHLVHTTRAKAISVSYLLLGVGVIVLITQLTEDGHAH